MVKDYNFDGVDLAWQFPVVKEKKERSTLGMKVKFYKFQLFD